jgi:hypothetical protein
MKRRLVLLHSLLTSELLLADIAIKHFITSLCVAMRLHGDFAAETSVALVAYMNTAESCGHIAGVALEFSFRVELLLADGALVRHVEGRCCVKAFG